MSEEFKANLTCNECDKDSPFDLNASDASDPCCSICGAFQMKIPQVIAYGQSLTNWLEHMPVSPSDFGRVRDMITRFFWLAERRGVMFSGNKISAERISEFSEPQLRTLAPNIQLVVAAMRDDRSH